MLAGDREKASEIIKEKDPVKQKNISKTIKIDDKLWKDRRIEIMRKGLLAKFRQNKYLKEALLETGDTNILEANPNDKFWGVGLSLQNPNI